jgi:hypothetical protein
VPALPVAPTTTMRTGAQSFLAEPDAPVTRASGR